MTKAVAERQIFACTGGVLAVCGYSEHESPDYAEEIHAYASQDWHNVIFDFEEDPSHEAWSWTYCVTCDMGHSDARPMFAGTETTFE